MMMRLVASSSWAAISVNPNIVVAGDEAGAAAVNLADSMTTADMAARPFAWRKIAWGLRGTFAVDWGCSNSGD